MGSADRTIVLFVVIDLEKNTKNFPTNLYQSNLNNGVLKGSVEWGIFGVTEKAILFINFVLSLIIADLIFCFNVYN